MKTKNKNGEIALVNTINKLHPASHWTTCGPEISVTIAVLSEKDTPQNWSMNYDTAKSSVGGCRARIFASDGNYHEKYQANLFGWYGPEIGYGDLREYEHGARAVKNIGKRLEEIYRDRGAEVDAADSMGRFLEACNIDQVWMRPNHDSNRSWLSEGDWRQLSVGEFVNLVRSNLYWTEPKPKMETTVTENKEEVPA